MDVAEADAGAALAGGSLLLPRIQQPLHHLLRHAGAVVGDVDDDIVPVPAGHNGDLAVPVGIGHAVVDGVFQDGLDNELDGVELLHAVPGLNGGGELVLVAHLLNGEIVAGMLQLIGNGDDVAAPAQGDPEEPGQGGEHHRGLVGAAVLRHPHHGVQGVIEEVGIDLGLKHIQLAASLLLLLAHHVVHQVAQGGDHGAHGVAQVLHFVGAAHVEVHLLLAGLQLLDGPVQLLYRGSDPLGQSQVHEHQQKDGEEHDEEEEEHQLAVVAPQVFRRHHAHQLPAGVAHGLDGHLPPLALEGLRMDAVGVGGGVQVVLLQKPRVDELLAGMVDDLAAVVDEIEVAAGV